MKKRVLVALLLIISLMFSSCGGDGGSEGTPDEGNTGTTNTWTPKPEVMKAKDGAGGIVVIIHDDGTYSTAEILNDILLRYGLVGDIALLGNKVWDQSTGTVKTEEANKWKKFLEAENEEGRFKIVSHSMTHTWWGTATEDGEGGYIFSDNTEKMYTEIVGAQNALRAAFPTERVLTYAYPGFWSERQTYALDGTKVSEDLVKQIIYTEQSRELVDETYISARYSYSQTYPYLNDPETVWNYVSSRQLGNGTGAAIADIYSARFSRLVVFFMHRIDHVSEDQLDSYDYPDNTMADYYMEEICKELAKDVNKGYLWNAHYEDAVLYVREATAATVTATGDSSRVEITLTDTLDDEIYDYPITVRMMIPDEWEKVSVTQNGVTEIVTPKVVSGRWVLDVNIVPDRGVATLVPIFD